MYFARKHISVDGIITDNKKGAAYAIAYLLVGYCIHNSTTADMLYTGVKRYTTLNIDERKNPCHHRREEIVVPADVVVSFDSNVFLKWCTSVKKLRMAIIPDGIIFPVIK
mmetsp:Transcript_14014/g.17709  ORF Transcript_14014/g.17709 Transcript_14014/m.17709 type:complete len:110 (+) Transcript_14014:834-1163(+)